MTALITGLCIGGVQQVFAADDVQEFTLDPMVVTATRSEKRDVDVPATIEVINSKEIKNAGYKNVFDVIDNQLGITSTGYGDAGQDFGWSSGRTVVRGFDRGTLVLVNGMPINLKNYNTADVVPVEMVERVEIIKGAASTLYGPEAMGGVVNIITKKSFDKEFTKVKGTIGNYYKDYGITYGNEKLIIDVERQFSDKYDDSNDYPKGSSTKWWIGKGQMNRAAATVKITDEIGLNAFYSEDEITRGGVKYKSNGKVDKTYDYKYEGKKANIALNYVGKDNGLKASAAYNYRQVDGYDYIKNQQVDSSCDLNSYIFDIQKEWQLNDKDKLIAGYTYRRENYDNSVIDSQKSHMTDNGIYISYDKAFGDKFNTIIGVRGDRFTASANGAQKNVFLPQIQTVYKFTDNVSWYTNVGKAYQMPPVDSYFKSGNFTNLQPEYGWNYETGVKILDDNKIYKLAVYHMDFKNKFGWSGSDKLGPDGQQYLVNKGDFRNTGVEAEFIHEVSDKWQYALGLGYSNPEIKDPTAKKPQWVQDAGRIDASASVTYKIDKLTSSLTYKYLGDREYYSGHDIPSRNRLTWNTSYDLTKNDNITLTVNNLLDRDNYSNRYGNLDLPLNWRVMYNHTF